MNLGLQQHFAEIYIGRLFILKISGREICLVGRIPHGCKTELRMMRKERQAQVLEVFFLSLRCNVRILVMRGYCRVEEEPKARHLDLRWQVFLR